MDFCFEQLLDSKCAVLLFIVFYFYKTMNDAKMKQFLLYSLAIIEILLVIDKFIKKIKI